jgi:flagellar motor switch protein FliG
MPPPTIRKAAILLTALPEEEAVSLMGKLSPRQVEMVSYEIATLSGLTLDEQESVITEFAASNPAAFGVNNGGLDRAKALVEKALGPNAQAAIDNLRQSIELKPFSFLKKINPQNIVSYIIEEHAQTIALILSYLPPSYGAQIIKGLSIDKQIQVVRRLADMGQTNPEVIREVEKGLQNRLANLTNQSLDSTGGVSSVAEILNVSDRAMERALMESLQTDDPELVDQIRKLMFVFEDISKLTDKDVQTVLKNVENSQWCMALKGTSEALRQKVLGNMSSRGAQNLREEMELMGAVKSADVEKVQQQIVDTIRKLEEMGQLTTRANDEAGALLS